jgi:hypothetical protein
MNEFFSNMTPLQRKIFYIAVFFVTLALFDRLLIEPTVSKRAEIDEQIKREKELIRGDIKILSYKGKIAKEKEILKPYFSDAIPKDEDVMSEFLGKLDTFAAESGLTVQKNNRSSDQTQEADDAGKTKDILVYKADFECSGNLEDVAKLIYRIDTSREFFKILKINLAMKKTGDIEEIRAVMTVAKYIVPTERALLASGSFATSNKLR